jgi:hypothetical protein
MTTASAATPHAQPATLSSSPVQQAFLLLRIGFTIAPIAFGLDKFLGLLADWPAYLWSGVDQLLPGTAEQVMLAVGVVEIAAGVLVAIKPRIGGYVVAAWLAVIIVNLLLLGDALDIALRDVGLLIGALALARLAAAPSGAR